MLTELLRKRSTCFIIDAAIGGTETDVAFISGADASSSSKPKSSSVSRSSGDESVSLRLFPVEETNNGSSDIEILTRATLLTPLEGAK